MMHGLSRLVMNARAVGGLAPRFNDACLLGGGSLTQCLFVGVAQIKPPFAGDIPSSRRRKLETMQKGRSTRSKFFDEIAAGFPGKGGWECRTRWANCLDPRYDKSAWKELDYRLLAEAQV